MAFDLRTLIHLSQSCFVFVAIVIAVSSTSGSESNETQEVTNLMDELFHEHHACNVPAMELGFLVSGSYSEPSEEGKRPFRKALDFVKKTTQKIKISDSGTHVGLVVYGENPYMAFDFNEYFDMPSLAQAIEEVKRPVKGSNVEEALKFAKKQLYDKSARPGVPKKLIILLSKKSQDMTNHGLELLKKAGVKVYTVRIKAKSDPLEMSDSAADERNSFVTDQDHLGSLVARVVPKLCEAPTELGEASDETSKNKMDPDEEPGAAVNSLTTPGIPRLPSKQAATTNEAQNPNKQLPTDEQGGRITETTSSNEDNFEDAINGTSTQVDIFDMLSGATEVDTDKAGMNEDSEANSGDGIPTPKANTTMDIEESTSTSSDSKNTSTATPKNSTPSVSHKGLTLKDLANKMCSAKADIGILIDGSSSIKQEQFSKLLDFTKSLARSFSVSEDRTHIAVATASNGPHMSFDLQGFHDVPSLNTAISRIAYFGGPFLLGSSLTGLKTSWFKNSGRKSIPQLLLVLATTSSVDDIVAPSRVLRDRGVRIESVGIGPGFDGTQLKEIATHPARDHVMAVSKFELLPMIRPLLTFRMCRAVGGKLVARPPSEIPDADHPLESPSSTLSIDTDSNTKQQQSSNKPIEQDVNPSQDTQAKPDKQVKQDKLEARLKQLDHYKQIHKQDSSDASGNSDEEDEIEKEKIREDIRHKLYALLRRLGGTKKDIGAAYRSIIYNINGHHDDANCKDTHVLCKQWAKDNLCERGNDTMDSQSVQRVCPKSCNVCYA